MPQSYVLVVDDDAGVRETVVEILEGAGIEAYGAGTGAAALRRAAQTPPAVAVVDYRLPDMTGIDVVERLKDSDPALPVIIVTGFTTLQTAATALGVVDEYLTKPVRPERIVASVRAMLDRRRLHAENAALSARVARAEGRITQQLAESGQELAALSGVLRGVVAAGAAGSAAVALPAALEMVRRVTGAAAVAAYVAQPTGELRLVAGVGDWSAPATLPAPPAAVVEDLLGRPERWATVAVGGPDGAVGGGLAVAEPAHASPRLLRALADGVAPLLPEGANVTLPAQRGAAPATAAHPA